MSICLWVCFLCTQRQIGKMNEKESLKICSLRRDQPFHYIMHCLSKRKNIAKHKTKIISRSRAHIVQRLSESACSGLLFNVCRKKSKCQLALISYCCDIPGGKIWLEWNIVRQYTLAFEVGHQSMIFVSIKLDQLKSSPKWMENSKHISICTAVKRSFWKMRNQEKLEHN